MNVQSYRHNKHNQTQGSNYFNKDSYSSQHNLKRLLKEFGLQQYLRVSLLYNIYNKKFYDLGYDDTNFFKLSTLTPDKFIDFMTNLNAFPGHKVKFIGLVEKLKKLVNLSKLGGNQLKEQIPNGTTDSKSKSKSKQKQSRRSTASNFKSNTNINFSTSKNNQIKQKPKTVEGKQRSSRQVNPYLTQDAFGFKYFLSDNEKVNGSINRHNT